MPALRIAAPAAVVLLVAAPSRAQDAGVLLGVSTTDDRGQAQRLRTYWIVGRARGAEVKAILPGLLVPRADGFARLGIVRTCEPIAELNEGLGGPGEGDVSCEDRYWIGPGEASPPADVGVPPTPDGGDPTPCAYTSRAIDFASPRAVAARVVSGQSESCEPRGFRWTERRGVASLDGDRAIDAAELLGPSAAASYARAARAAERDLAREFEIADAACSVDTGNLAAWTIARTRGAWRAELFQQDGEGWCAFSAPLDLRLSVSLTGPDRSIPERRIVMVQWAAGTHVARWTAYIAGLAQVPDEAGGPAVLR